MTLQPAQLHETMAFVAADRAEMVEALAIALAIESDGWLQAQLRELARASDGQPFMVDQPGSCAWLKFGNDRRVTVHRERVDGLETVHLDLALRSNLDLMDALKRALSRTAIAAATKLLDPLWEMKDIPSREQYAVLHRWSPLLEQLAYKSGTRLSILLDLLRPEIRRNLAEGENVDPQLYTYWSALHVMANLIMLASDAQSRPWLNDMASQLSWTTWTPTFPLLRERTVWLAACAARSAVAFGEPVIGQYLAMLSKAEHPMKAFDSLFGLVAIALDRKALARSILSEIRSLKQQTLDARQVPHTDYFRMAYDDAIRVISEGGSTEQAEEAEIQNLDWGTPPRMGLATRAALCADPASFSASRRFVGFSILPIVVSAAPEEHYCTTAIRWRDLDLSGEDIASTFRRAWVPNSQGAASHILQ